MCVKCYHVFCIMCQKTYFGKEDKVDCSLCRQEIKKKDRFKPLTKTLLKKMITVQFLCEGCPSILSVNGRGACQGVHTETCQVTVNFKCGCGLSFSGKIIEVEKILGEHLQKSVQLSCAHRLGNWCELPNCKYRHCFLQIYSNSTLSRDHGTTCTHTMLFLYPEPMFGYKI